MRSSSWLLRCLPYVVGVGLASAVVLSSLSSSSPAKQQRSAAIDGAFSRHPLSEVYSDLPYRDPLPVLMLSFIAHWLLFHLCPLLAACQPPPPNSATATTVAAATSLTAGSPSLSSAVQRNYCVSTVHAATAVCSVVVWLLVYEVEWRSVQRGLGGGRRGTGDEWQSLAVGWSLGYFAFDLVCMAVHSATRSTGAVVHHCAIGSAFLLGLYTDCCRPFHFLFLLEELSTPPLNVKSLLRHHQRLADFCAALFAASFVCVRLGYGTALYVLACMQFAPFVRQAVADGERMQAAAALFQFVMCTASRALNLYWATIIAQKCKRTMEGAVGNKKHKVRGEAGGEGGGGRSSTQAAGGAHKLD